MSDLPHVPAVPRMTDARPAPLVTQLLLNCGVIGPALFIVALLIEGATRPGYSACRNYRSSLSHSTMYGVSGLVVFSRPGCCARRARAA